MVIKQLHTSRHRYAAAITAECSTGKYAAILHPGGSLYAAAAVNPCEKYLTIELLQQRKELLLSATIIVADTNLSSDVLAWLIQLCNNNAIPLCIEPVSVSKAKRLQHLALQGVWMMTPNEDEIYSLTTAHDEQAAIDQLQNRGVKNIWLTKGAQGSSMYTKEHVIHLLPVDVAITDSTGAGDAALAAYIAAWCMGMDPINCMRSGHVLAAHVLQQHGAVATAISQQKLFTAIQQHYPA